MSNVKRYEVCRWSVSGEDDVWSTGCGNNFMFITDGPEDNGFEYCPYCGKKLEVIA